MRPLPSPIVEHFGVIKTLGCRAQMPLAYHGGFMPFCWNTFGKVSRSPLKSPIHSCRSRSRG